KGSEFVVRLPSCPAPPQAVISPGVTPARNLPGRRVLVVDDNEDAVESLALLLSSHGHEVRTAYDGPDALELAEAFRPEVVILDIGLPRMDGYEVACRLRERAWTRDLLLVALTGYGREEDRRRAHEAGFDWHLVKPVDPEVLRVLLDPAVPSQTGAAG